MPLFATRTSCSGSRVFEQRVKIAATGNRLGDFLELFGIVCYCTISCIRLDLGSHFGIHFGSFAWTHCHFTAIGHLQLNLGAIRGSDSFTFTDNIT